MRKLRYIDTSSKLFSPFKRSRPEATIHEKDGVVLHYTKFLKKSHKPRRALLSYLSQPIIDDLHNIPTTRFSSDGIVTGWAKALNELGYIVDVINWDDQSFVVDQDYDLLVFHGAHNFEHLKKFANHFKKSIYFSTGSYWKFHNDQEDKRFADFKKRRGIDLPRDRYIDAPEEEAYKFADGLVLLGDSSMATTYPYRNTFTINNASYPDPHFDETEKDYITAKSNFLYFAGSGNIHKGLDLLIEAFASLEANLYVVGRLDEAVMKAYKKELSSPNFHVIGEVNMRTHEFYEAMDVCAFAILPSCSEGQAGSIVECMNQGLIPIVSKETRLDAKDFGFTLSRSTITEIRQTVREVLSLPVEEVKKRSLRTRQNAKAEHSPEYFNKTLKQHIAGILK